MALTTQRKTPQVEDGPVIARADLSEARFEPATLNRTPTSSSPDKQYRSYKALVDRANEVFGDDLTAARWLSMPSVDLDNKVPLQVAHFLNYDPDRMKAIFEPIFIRIEHGIYA
jgi:uncharacterized protein (DUF2384 family)